MSNVNRWAAFAMAALVLAGIVGAIAYNAGVAQGVEQSGKIVVAPAGAPYPYYGWYPRAGFGFFIPLAFIAFWLLVARGLFWRGGCARHYRGRPVDPGEPASR